MMKKNRVFLDKVNKHTENKDVTDYLEQLSKYSNIPIEIIKTDYKQYIARKHNFLSRTVDVKAGYYEIFKSLIKYYLTFIYVYIHSKKIEVNKKVKIIFDEVMSITEHDELSFLIKKFPDHLFISNEDVKENNQLKFYKRQGYCREIIHGNFIQIFFKITWISFKYSRKTNNNLINFSNYVVNQKLKYETIFSKYKSDIFFQFRFYTTSAIRNYLFKKNGGKLCCTFQRILIHLGRTGYFIDTDILFSLGKKSAELISDTDSNFKEIVPVGSLILEKFWFNTKKLTAPSYDILFIGGNHGTFLATDEKYMSNYYENLKWLSKFSKKFPKISIALKHHESWKKELHFDKKEDEILNGSFIKKIYKTEQGPKNKSYGYAFNSKVCLSWNSTMVFELLGHKIPAYFLDPNLENDGWFLNSNYTLPWRIDSYENFEKKMIKIIINNKKDIVQNSENFCLKSENTSQNIFDKLKNI